MTADYGETWGEYMKRTEHYTRLPEEPPPGWEDCGATTFYRDIVRGCMKNKGHKGSHGCTFGPDNEWHDWE